MDEKAVVVIIILGMAEQQVDRRTASCAAVECAGSIIGG
jgi:hypothetical protein